MPSFFCVVWDCSEISGSRESRQRRRFGGLSAKIPISPPFKNTAILSGSLGKNIDFYLKKRHNLFMENLALSADGEIKLYEVSQTILDNFDDILDQFYEWKTTKCYDEQLFVKFLQTKFGIKSVKFIKNLGYDMPKEYEHIFWYNF